MKGNFEKEDLHEQIIPLYNNPDRDAILAKNEAWLKSDVGTRYQAYAAEQDGKAPKGWYGRSMKWIGGLGLTLGSPMKYVKKPFTYLANTSAGQWVGSTRVGQFIGENPLYAYIAGGLAVTGAGVYFFRERIFGSKGLTEETNARPQVPAANAEREAQIREKLTPFMNAANEYLEGKDKKVAGDIINQVAARYREGKPIDDNLQKMVRAVQSRIEEVKAKRKATAKAQEAKKKEEEAEKNKTSYWLWGLLLLVLVGVAIAGYLWWNEQQKKAGDEEWDVENPKPRSQPKSAPLPLAEKPRAPLPVAEKPRKVVQQDQNVSSAQRARAARDQVRKIKMAYGPHAHQMTVAQKLPGGSANHSPNEIIAEIRESRESQTNSPRAIVREI